MYTIYSGEGIENAAESRHGRCDDEKSDKNRLMAEGESGLLPHAMKDKGAAAPRQKARDPQR